MIAYLAVYAFIYGVLDFVSREYETLYLENEPMFDYSQLVLRLTKTLLDLYMALNFLTTFNFFLKTKKHVLASE